MAGLDFGEAGLSFYEPKPYLFVFVNKDCVSTATVISLPGDKKSVMFKSGYGSADLSIALSNGILTNAGQKTDTKIPETITSIASLGAAMAALSATKKGAKQVICKPSAILYPIENGVPKLDSPAEFPIQSQVVDAGK
jgi:hypothetical protein